MKKILEARGGGRRRRAGAALAAAAVAASVLTLAGPVSSASAAGSCHGSGCTGKDPQATGCGADAYTVESVSPGSADYGIGNLRYSPSCDAAWLRVVSWENDVPLYGSVYGEVYLSGTWVPLLAENAPEVAGGTSWSRMIGGYPHYDIRVEG